MATLLESIGVLIVLAIAGLAFMLIDNETLPTDSEDF